ncbi:MAG: glycosyltransferase family 2 protein, partial [Verrucomicrobiaceae bacterium]
DGTTAEALAAGVEVVRHEINQGKGAAIKTGLKQLISRPEVEYVLLLDGDGQHLPEEIPEFLAEANRSGAAAVVGNRMAKTAEMPFVRKLTNQTMSRIISLICGQRIPDSQCGFRMLRKDLLPSLFVDSNRYDYETEMLLIASRKGLQIVPVPVSTIYGGEKSKINPVLDTLRFLRLMARYRRKQAPL